MIYKETLETKNLSKGTNSKEFIILHHTATGEGSIKGVLRTLTVGAVSCHYVIDTNGDTYKIGDDNMILWHAGRSSWGKRTDLNRYSIGIEIIGPLANGGFTDAQRVAVKALVRDLAEKYKLDETKILRHKDISPGRKVDPYDTLWNTKFKTFDEYKKDILAKAPEPVGENLLRQDMAKMILKINPAAVDFWNTLEGTRQITRSEFVAM
jgi:N-acetyl-anhydromuramyl-L-alanine amidase AmpD